VDWANLPPLILAVATAVGAARLLELLVTRRKVRGEGQKLEVDAAQVISTELRAWAAAAEERATRADERAKATEDRLSKRVDEVMAKLADAEDSLDRLEAKIARCQGGPPCPVRTSGTDPRLPAVNRTR
jgi:hypothetical protein